MAAVVPARTDRWGCKLAAAALALAAVWAPRSADAQAPTLEAAYVVLGPQGRGGTRGARAGEQLS